MSEFIDLYDQNRKLLNQEVDRTTYLFQPGEFMMYVLAILENSQGEFLVTQRAFNKKWAAGNWEMPGGGAKSKESSLDAIKREVKEETGLDVKNGGLSILILMRIMIDMIIILWIFIILSLILI